MAKFSGSDVVRSGTAFYLALLGLYIETRIAAVILIVKTGSRLDELAPHSVFHRSVAVKTSNVYFY